MREIRTSGVTREGVAGLRTRPLYSTVFVVATPLWCDESICDVSVSLCASVPLWFICDGAMDPRHPFKSVFIRVQM